MNRDNWRSEANYGMREAGWGIRRILVWAFGLGVTLIPLGLGAHACGWFGEAVAVVRQEVGPRELLRKYSWFKDAAAALDAKRSTIDVYAVRVKDTLAAYGDKPRSEWPRDERESMRTWQQEVAGVKASYNRLAAEYNAQMAKIHWAFCNAGSMPAGASQVLPREFREYIGE